MRRGAHIIRKWMKDGCLALLLCLLLSVHAAAGVPVLSTPVTTDITTRSFSVVLTTSEAATAVLSLFGADCATAVTGFDVAVKQNSASGIMRISISSLNAATSYCYQLAVTSTSTSDKVTTVAAPVVTATAIVRSTPSGATIVPSGNDIVRMSDVHLPSGVTRDTILSTLELLNGSALSPLSLQLSGNPGGDYFNLNNLFTRETGSTLHLVGGERVKITENHGTSGCVIDRFRTVPSASGGTAPRTFVQTNPHDIDASGGVNILDVLRVVGGKGTTKTGTCFNSDLDLNGDGDFKKALAIIKGGFNGLP